MFVWHQSGSETAILASADAGKGHGPKRDAVAKAEVVHDSMHVITAPQENILTMPLTLANCELYVWASYQTKLPT